MRGDVMMVLFRLGDSGFRLEDTEQVLINGGLKVERREEAFGVRYFGGPELVVTSTTEPHVAIEAAEIGEGTPFAAELRRCDARFEVSIKNLDEALEDIETLIVLQSTLQNATGGYVFSCWNNRLSGPKKTG